MNSANPSWTSLTVVPLGTTFLHGPLISHELATLLSSLEENKQKALILYNRRGFGRAWICQDCGYFPLCPHCDIALAYHTSPHKQLVCHHCSYRMPLFVDCPSCGWQHFDPVGSGIQEIERTLRRLFPRLSLLRIDSDTTDKKSHILTQVAKHEIILTTFANIALSHADIDHIIVLLFESDLTLPDYRMEEELYHTVDYLKKSEKPLLIQTYTPNHPLLSLLSDGNYKDFLRTMSEERKEFHYPPYTEFALIRIHDENKDKVIDMENKIVNKLSPMISEGVFFAYDKEITDRSRGEWTAKIILKGKEIKTIVDTLETEITRNRSVTLEWR